MIAERLFQPRPPDDLARWCFIAFLFVLICVLMPEGVRLALRYDRAAILAGEWYRLLTGNLVHSDVPHLLYNLASLLLLGILDLRVMGLHWRLFETTVLCVGTGLGLLLTEPQLDWYVGLSGALHGMIILAILPDVRKREFTPTLVLVILIGKLIWEHYYGQMPWSRETIEVPVIVASHSWGAASAAVWLIGAYLIKFFSRRFHN
jgi:rhomboid family GlyGly-CTERM serine protease